MKSRFTITALILATAGYAGLSGTAFAAEMSGDCTLKRHSTVVGKGSCEANQNGDVVAIKGTIEENGQKYSAVIDNNKNTGVLIGAGTFPLADGELAKNEATKVVWPNGYKLKFKF